MQSKLVRVIIFVVILFVNLLPSLFSQSNLFQNMVWSKNKNGYFFSEFNKVFFRNIEDGKISKIIDIVDTNFRLSSFSLSNDETKFLIFYNTKRKWRYNTIGSYLVFDTKDSAIYHLGDSTQGNDLMFAKFSNNAQKIGYVFKNDVYVENFTEHQITQLTNTGTDNIFNGTYDWSYEEEFKAFDGFRFSDDDSNIAFMKLDATAIPYFTMINNTDSAYPKLITFPFPKVSYPIPQVSIGIVSLTTKKINWITNINFETEYFVPRMEWIPTQNKIIFQVLNRAQTKSKIYTYNNVSKKMELFYVEADSVWIDIKSMWHDDLKGWEWINKDGDFLLMSEKDGFRHLWKINSAGEDTLVTQENFDVIDLLLLDTVKQEIYFTASPDNPTQQYLYKKSLYNISAPSQRLTPNIFKGTNDYNLSLDGKYAVHTFSNYYTPFITTLVQLSDNTILFDTINVIKYLAHHSKSTLKNKIKYITIASHGNSFTYDAWVVYPNNFNANKKYPVLFYAYGEPASQVVKDKFGSQRSIYADNGDTTKKMIYVGIENRGSPSPKGKAWRKAIYKNNGIVNVLDQATAAKEVLKWKFIDTSRVGIWGWSGGGTMALNLILRYPEIYKTALSIAPVTDLKLYDNIYEERYNGLLTENAENYAKGSPINYAANLKGNLLIIHGSGDDNVHYQHFELMVNKLIEHKKYFQVFVYPNRSHGLYEGLNTQAHLRMTITEFLNKNLFH